MLEKDQQHNVNLECSGGRGGQVHKGEEAQGSWMKLNALYFNSITLPFILSTNLSDRFHYPHFTKEEN